MPTSFPTSRHALTRMQHRGVKREIIECLFTYGDMEASTHGSTRLRLSARGADELLMSREVPAECVRRASRLILIVGDDETLITAYWTNPRPNASRSWSRPRSKEAA